MKTETTQITQTAEDAQKIRARARRAAKRGTSDLDGPMAKCPLCGFEAHSLVSHITKEHGMKAYEVELKAGLKPGTFEVNSPALIAKLAEAGRKGGLKTRENKAQAAAA